MPHQGRLARVSRGERPEPGAGCFPWAARREASPAVREGPHVALGDPSSRGWIRRTMTGESEVEGTSSSSAAGACGGSIRTTLSCAQMALRIDSACSPSAGSSGKQSAATLKVTRHLQPLRVLVEQLGRGASGRADRLHLAGRGHLPWGWFGCADPYRPWTTEDTNWPVRAGRMALQRGGIRR